MKLLFVLGLLLVTGCAETGKVINDSLNGLQYSTNGYTGSNFVGLTEQELLKKINKADKEIILDKDKKLLYGRRNDAYLMVSGKVDRAYQVSDIVYEVKYNSLGALPKAQTIAFIPASGASTVSFQSALEPMKNILRFKGHKIVDNPKKAQIVVTVQFGSEKSLKDKNLDAFFKIEKASENSFMRYMDLSAKENGKELWLYKAITEGSKEAIEPAIAAMAFAGINDIPRNSLGTKTATISETDPAITLIGLVGK